MQAKKRVGQSMQAYIHSSITTQSHTVERKLLLLVLLLVNASDWVQSYSGGRLVTWITASE
jgi:hypothetical protein